MYAETPITAANDRPVNNQCLIGRVTGRASRAVIAIGDRGESRATRAAADLEFFKFVTCASTASRFKKKARN